MTPAITEKVLVYTRIAHNKRKTWLLVAFAIFSIIPFVAAVSYGVSAIIISEVDGRAHQRRVNEIHLHQRIADATRDLSESGYSDMMQARVRELREKDAGELKQDREIQLQIMGAVAFGSIAVLGILFWGIASSPTSKVLALCGARPGDVQEAEAKRILENLSIGAGLPPPKLYVIESSSPNAFAAGTDPQHSVIVVTRGLLMLMDHRELEGVLAHELSHIANHDTRLNTIVASIALFLRLPYLLRKRQMRESNGRDEWSPFYRRFQIYRLALSPLYVYIFFIAPAMASIIRAAISRGREYLADADAALLTRYPEGLMRALAKIRGAGSALTAANPVVSHFYFSDPAPVGFNFGMFSGNLLATHPPIDQRIIRLMEFHGGVTASVVEEAIKAGQQFTRDHPAMAENDFAPVAAADELSVLTVGNPMGRVCQVVGLKAPIPVLETPTPHALPLARIHDGDFIVVFDDPGKYRQIITANQTFGYIPYSVKLKKTDMFPNELFGMKPVARPEPQPAAAAVAAPLAAATPGAVAVAVEKTPVSIGEHVPSPPSVAAVLPPTVKSGGLTKQQIVVAAVFFISVFGIMFLALTKFAN